MMNYFEKAVGFIGAMIAIGEKDGSGYTLAEAQELNDREGILYIDYNDSHEPVSINRATLTDIELRDAYELAQQVTDRF